MNAILVSDTSPSGPSGDDGKISLNELQEAIFSNRSYTAELLIDELIVICTAQNSVQIEDETVDLTEACNVLRGYNRRLDLESKGAVLFREWITLYKNSETRNKGKLFSIPFDAKDPVNTPRELADKELALQNLARAVKTLEGAGIKLDSTLGETQFAYRGDEKIAIHGGGGTEGIANVIGQRNYDSLATQIRGKKIKSSKYLTDKGYAITYGTSFIMSLSYTDDGPIAEALLTYSESGDPSSEHYTDQTKLFSAKHWRPVLFNREDITKDTKTKLLLTGKRSH
jgi:acyl-homoserine-lactone acylase